MNFVLRDIIWHKCNLLVGYSSLFNEATMYLYKIIYFFYLKTETISLDVNITFL